MRTAAAILGLLFMTSVMSMTACTRGRGMDQRTAENGGEPANGASELAKGSQLFGFDYEKVTELLIVKNDPETGDRWAARLFASPAGAGTRPGGDRWQVERAGGEGAAPLDSRADGYFVLHLLDTLRTLRAERVDVPGALESLGLAPPRFALKWKTPGHEYSVELGGSEEGAVRAYARVPGHNPLVADGAAIQMLGYLRSFERLRLKTWAGVVVDDVDEIEIPPGFYAQREGSDWTDRKHRSLKADVDGWLDRLAHARVLAFVDDRARAEPIARRLAAAPARKATLRDRHGNPIRLAIAQVDGKWYASSDARPGGVFEIYAKSAHALDRPSK
jgi:hypothetical protein